MEGDYPWLEPLVTFLSVLLGATLAWGTTVFFERKKEKSQNLALAYSLMFKVQTYADDLVKLEQHVFGSIEEADKNGAEGPAWVKIFDLVGPNDPRSLTTSEELALLARTKDSQLVMDVRELEAGHGIMLAAFEKMSSLRKQLGDSGLAKSAKGRLVTIEATNEEYAKFAPVLVGLNMVSENLVETLPRIVVHARTVANRLGPELKNHYKFQHFIKLEM